MNLTPLTDLPLPAKLTEQQLCLLGYFAYHGKAARLDGLLPFALSHFKLNEKKLRSEISILEKTGMLDVDYYFRFHSDFYDTQIDPPYYFNVVLYVFFHHPEWEMEYRRAKAPRDIGAIFLWDAARAVAYHDKKLMDSLVCSSHWPKGNVADYLIPFHPYPEFHPLFASLSPNQFCNVFDDCLYSYYYDDIPLDGELHDILQALVDSYPPAKTGDTTTRDCLRVCNDLLDMNLLFSTGRIPPTPAKDSTWSLVSQAVVALYRGDVEASLAFFAKALKLHNRECDEKNLFRHPLLCFYLMMAYLKAATPESRDLAAKYLRKKIAHEEEEQYPAMLLAEYLTRGCLTSEMQYYMRKLFSSTGGTPWAVALLQVLVHYFKLDAPEFIKDAGRWRYEPQWALLRYELDGLRGQLSPASRQLQETLGGAPVLASVHCKERWELLVDDLLKICGGKDDGNSGVPARDSRIGYFFYNQYHLEIRQQKLLKNGTWGLGSKVAVGSFMNGKCEGMDETDVRIVKSLRGRIDYYYDISPRHVAPYLVGTDRAYTQHEKTREYLPVEITEEKPFITINRVEGGFKVDTNVQRDELGSRSNDAIVEYIDATHYKVYRLDTTEAQIFSMLLSLGTFPDRAEETLKGLLKRLSGHIEIHSPLLDGGSTLQQREGDSTILLTLTPSRNALAFRLAVRVQPLQGGRLRVLPAGGQPTVYDEAEGVRYQVLRNLAAEQQAFALLPITLDDEGDAELDIVGALDLIDFVQQHPDTYAMEWPESAPLQLRPRLEDKAVNVRLTSHQNWFDVEGEVQLDKETLLSSAEFLGKILQGISGGRYIRLGENEYVTISESLAHSLQRLSQLAQYDNKGAHVPKYQAGALAEIIGAGEGIQADKGFARLKNKINKAAAMQIEVPRQLQAQLRDYQEEGFRWMVRLTEWGAGACLADDMGLGKTIQAIALMLHRADKGPALVVCPASVVFNWRSELARFAPTLECHILGEEEDRSASLGQLGPYCVLLTTYGLLVREAEALQAVKWNLAVLDEAHTIKNRATKMSAAAMQLQAAGKIILTGTPVQNNLAELWNLFQFLNPGLLGSYNRFEERYIQPEGKAAQAQLRRLIQPFLLRRTKGEVAEELPDKTDITRLVTLTPAEQTAYEALRLSAKKAIEEEKKVNVNVLAMITKLREAACSLALVNQEWTLGSSKIEAFKELVGEIVEGGNRVLAFSQFTSFLTQVRKALEDMGDIPCLYLDGSTPIKKREKMVNDFQHGLCPVFLISLKAGGLGLNLTGANYVIHLDPWWNPAIEQQATDRAYRIGQQQNVTVYHLVSDHTIEQKIMRLHKTKRDMADALLSDNATARAMTLDDLKYLVDNLMYNE